MGGYAVYVEVLESFRQTECLPVFVYDAVPPVDARVYRRCYEWRMSSRAGVIKAHGRADELEDVAKAAHRALAAVQLLERSGGQVELHGIARGRWWMQSRILTAGEMEAGKEG